MTPTIVLIHGLWMTPQSWEPWVRRYTDRGFHTIAPAWPGMDRPIEALREDSSAIDHLGITEIVDHYDAIIAGMAQPPIIMGHSFGGLITQILLDRGRGIAGIAIDSAPVKGVLSLPVSAIRSSLPALKNPANNHKSVMLSPEEFHYAFTNTLTAEQSLAIYERQAVPGPGRVLFQAALANLNPHAASKVHFENDDRAPLLIIAGAVDHVSPPSVNQATARLQHRSGVVTDYKEFSGRSHYIIGQEGWEEVADYAIAWALKYSDRLAEV
jgi:pimeloyl-ACP methyl ester carboxylesterase